jgi:hypothetical protein
LNLGKALVEQIFSDGIGSITVIGGTVRIDFVTFSPNDKEANGQPKVVHLQQIVMVPEGFLRSSEKIQEAAQALSKLGVTAARPSGEPRIVEPSAPPSASGQPPSATPPKRPFP